MSRSWRVGPRPLRPRTPEDRPDCREATSAPSPAETTTVPLRPWREAKCRRGAPKRINTKGFACPNPDREFRGKTDAQVHAVVGYGHHGQQEPIQDLYCQACHHKFTVRRETPLYRLETSAARVAMILMPLGSNVTVAVRANRLMD